MMNIPWDHADAGAAVRDAAAALDFPQRRWCFGAEWLGRGLPQALADADGRPPRAGAARAVDAPAQATVDNVWYLPGRQLTVVYRTGAHARVTLVFARAGEAPAPPADPAARWLPEARAWAWPWPADPAGLPLARWSDPAWARAQLAALDRAAVDAAPPVRCDVLSYLPGHRCAVRWRPPGDAHAGWVMKGQPGAGADAAAVAALWRRPGRRFVLPEPLGAAAPVPACGAPPVHGVRWERFVPGERLEAAAVRLGWAPVLRAAVAAVADLHRHAVPGLAVTDEAAALARLQGKVMKRIAVALPERRADGERLVARLQARLPRAPGPRTTLHGDLHTGNLLHLADGRIAFIDLDNLVQGAPAADLALLASRLMLLQLLDPALAPALAGPLAALPDWYVDAGGDPRALDAYPWYLALMLVARQVRTCVRHHAPGLPALAEALCALAGEVLAD